MLREDISLKILSEEVCEMLADAAKLKDVSLEVTSAGGVIKGTTISILFESRKSAALYEKR